MCVKEWGFCTMKFKRKFFQKPTVEVAQALLGQNLVRITSKGVKLKGRILETEAYLGLKDPCCHSFKGSKTKRTRVMYQPGGVAYVYFIYGMHHCFNVVTGKEGEPEAVLIRALKPLEGLPVLKKNRGASVKNLLNGPGKICQAMEIDTSLSGQSLLNSPLYIEKGVSINRKSIVTTPRVGLNPENPASLWPLRFYVPQGD